jgi:hypothetical protein
MGLAYTLLRFFGGYKMGIGEQRVNPQLKAEGIGL